MLWVKKATGLGITELILRWIIFQALTNPQLKNSQVCIVTAPRLELAISLIDRINKIFPSEDHKATSTTINGVKIEAFPSHHLDTMRVDRPYRALMRPGGKIKHIHIRSPHISICISDGDL